MSYDLKDGYQAALGGTVAMVFFYLLRMGSKIELEPTKGLIIGLIWAYIVSAPFISKNDESKIHAIGNLIVVISISTILAVIFNLMVADQIFTFGFFGQSGWLVGVFLGLPTAHFFDKYNILNLYERWYHRRR